jgi:hypothetical protein
MANNLLNSWAIGINLRFTGLKAVISYCKECKEPHTLSFQLALVNQNESRRDNNNI